MSLAAVRHPRPRKQGKNRGWRRRRNANADRNSDDGGEFMKIEQATSRSTGPSSRDPAAASEPHAGRGEGLLDRSLKSVKDGNRQGCEHDRNDAGQYKGLHCGSLAGRIILIQPAMQRIEAYFH
jgi:hypothetical protein